MRPEPARARQIRERVVNPRPRALDGRLVLGAARHDAPHRVFARGPNWTITSVMRKYFGKSAKCDEIRIMLSFDDGIGLPGMEQSAP